MYNNGNKLIEIASLLKTAPRNISNVLKENNIPLRQSLDYSKNALMSRKMFFTIKEINNMITLYEDWSSVEDIAKIYEVSSFVIYRVLKENNITIRKCSDRQCYTDYITNKKYFCDETYFEKIDTEEKSYWLGFIYADGNVYIGKGINGGTKGGTLEIALKASDSYMLENFNRDIKGDYIVKERKVKCNNKYFDTARILIHNIKICNDLIELGCIPNKSLVVKPPTKIPKQFINAFVRGYFDGDGCVGYYPYSKSTKAIVGFTGNQFILSWIEKIIIQNGVLSTKLKKDSRSNVYRLDIYGRGNMINFYNYIYKDAHYVMDRKQEKFHKMAHGLNMNINRGWLSQKADELII